MRMKQTNHIHANVYTDQTEMDIQSRARTIGINNTITYFLMPNLVNLPKIDHSTMY